MSKSKKRKARRNVARGIAHIGVLRAFEQNGIPIDYLAGTSVGALIATMYSAGSKLETMERLAAQTSFKDFGKWTISWLGFATNAPLSTYLQRAATVQDFNQLKIPLTIVATDLGTGEPVHFSSGEIIPPLRASCAYPSLFMPVEHNGRIYVDGFLASPVPVDAVRAMGADIVIAVYLDSCSDDERPANLIGVVGRAFSIMQRHVNKLWRQNADIIIEPSVSQYCWDDFCNTPALLQAGERAANDIIPVLRQLIEPQPTVTAQTPQAPRQPAPLPAASTSAHAAD